LTKAALHLGVVLPFIGDASLEETVEEFTKAAKKVRADRVRIVSIQRDHALVDFSALLLLLHSEIDEYNW
jgi:hypothetical protein